jgi:hypothetical protein
MTLERGPTTEGTESTEKRKRFDPQFARISADLKTGEFKRE